MSATKTAKQKAPRARRVVNLQEWLHALIAQEAKKISPLEPPDISKTTRILVKEALIARRRQRGESTTDLVSE